MSFHMFLDVFGGHLEFLFWNSVKIKKLHQIQIQRTKSYMLGKLLDIFIFK